MLKNNLTFNLPLGDSYQRNARVYPMVIALAPIVLVLWAWLSLDFDWKRSALSAAILAAAAFVLSAVSRNAGRKVESRLKLAWGGFPSVLIMRHRDNTIDPISKAAIHRQLQEAVPGSIAPTAEDEAQAPEKADAVYTAWSEHLRIKARQDQKKYALVFQENCSYGFHRNLLGLKPFAFPTWLVCGGVLAYAMLTRSRRDIELQHVVAIAGLVLLLVFWLRVVNENSVREAAYDYAKRLIEDCAGASAVKTPKRARKQP